MPNNITHKILLGLTTTPRSDWREKIKEIDFFGISEISFFPTKLNLKERKECYALLEKSALKKIYHVHLRNDMEEWEIEYLIKKYGTEVFNTHPKANRFSFDLEKSPLYASKIFLENVQEIPSEKELKKSGGLCLDFSHWESAQLVRWKAYKNLEKLIAEFPVGCCHVSAITNDLITEKNWHGYDSHWLYKLSQLDYIKKYIRYFPKYISLELENSFSEQLKIKKYLEKIIYEKGK